ncbi:expressed unknown protein [Ectocarpus siliculosus]|uniref:Uncharacterized protein n=1 Tax=Ectocarpus siliculosus TaxID=2880 RepID=D7FNC6_ECTSI|nr:expressed unknown protein [Ectocarpus siliculosus]|eukprot:CBJ30180.1 expressed unknown protein [Ectocarpus siliculosus]
MCWQDLFPPPTPTFLELGASAMISKSKTREARKRRPALRRSHLLVAILMSAMTVSVVESNSERRTLMLSAVLRAEGGLPTYGVEFGNAVPVLLMTTRYPTGNTA